VPYPSWNQDPLEGEKQIHKGRREFQIVSALKKVKEESGTGFLDGW
jgi:hypothetical protein